MDDLEFGKRGVNFSPRVSENKRLTPIEMEDDRPSGSSFISQTQIQGLPGYSSLQDFLTILREEQSKLGLETTNQTIVVVI
jgi:hypothetical protein